MTARPARIMAVDEEAPLTHVLSLAIGLEGWDTRVVRRGEDVLSGVHEFEPDVILLDMMLPDASGVDVVARLRSAGVTVPVMFLTGRSSHEDRMAAFIAGADDYMTKPFSLEDVVARLRAILRRIGLSPTSRTFSDLVLDEATAEAWRANERILLTQVEFELLRPLVVEGAPMTVGEIMRRAAQGGLTITRRAAERVLDEVRAKVNQGRDALLYLTDSGEWMLAPAT